MADDLPNLPMLIKLMKLTASTNDAEALLAVRKANEQLLKFGGDWEKLLLGKVTVIADPFAGVAAPAREDIKKGNPNATPRPYQPPPPPRPTQAPRQQYAPPPKRPAANAPPPNFASKPQPAQQVKPLSAAELQARAKQAAWKAKASKNQPDLGDLA